MEHGTAHAAEGTALNRLAVSATNHCLTGCVIGEVTGMFIATALGWGDVASIALAVGLAYIFGFSLTARPLVRAGLAAGCTSTTRTESRDCHSSPKSSAPTACPSQVWDPQER